MTFWTLTLESVESVIHIDIDKLVPFQEGADAPEWMDLAYHKCQDCPLHQTKSGLCPAASRIYPLVQKTNHMASTDRIKAILEYGEFRIEKSGSFQDVFASLISELLFQSDCPILGRVRPVIHFIPPFPSVEVIFYHALTFELMTLLFEKEGTELSQVDLNQAVKKLEEGSGILRNVLRDFVERLTDAQTSSKEGLVNSVVAIHSSLNLLNLEKKNTLEKLRRIFRNQNRNPDEPA